MPARFYNTVTVDGVEVCAALGCVIEYDSFEMDPPEAVTTFVDVPGRIDGPVDMSEALTGYPCYGARKMKVNFIAKAHGREAGEQLLSRAMSMLHHRRAEIQLGWDPGYTYTGRVSVSSLRRNLLVAGFTMEAVCEPYKTLRHVTVTEDCGGGVELELESGTAPVVPTWRLDTPTSIHMLGSGIAYDLPAGIYQLPDLVLRSGVNTVYVVSEGDLAPNSLRLGSEVASDTLDSWKNRTIADWIYKVRPAGGTVTVDYDWKDL